MNTLKTNCEKLGLKTRIIGGCIVAVYGNTYPHKEQLKAWGLRWDPKFNCWNSKKFIPKVVTRVEKGIDRDYIDPDDVSALRLAGNRYLDKKAVEYTPDDESAFWRYVETLESTGAVSEMHRTQAYLDMILPY